MPGSSRVRIQFDTSLDAPFEEIAFERAGLREREYFDPYFTTAAIATCGGLCPGLNNVVRSIDLELTHNYGVDRVLGIRNGYLGLNPAAGLEPIVLTEEKVCWKSPVRWTILWQRTMSVNLTNLLGREDLDQCDLR